MKFVTYAQNLHDLNIIKANDGEEVILGHKDFSRFGRLSTEGFFKIASRARQLGLKVIFEWDILMTQNTFEEVSSKLSVFNEFIDVLRVQDPGALEWALSHTQYPLHFIAENGNHNLKGLKSWSEYAKERLKRLVLSIELSKDKIEEYCQALSVPCEILGLGPILLFYTPRMLLAPHAENTVSVNHQIMALGESEESPHKGFPILENKHGTFMFHIKDFCLLEFVSDLKLSGLANFRVDLRWQSFDLFTTVLEIGTSFNQEKFDSFKTKYTQDFMRGFYHVNKSDVLFPKLKNHRLQKREGNFIGEVLESQKGSHLAIAIKHPRGLFKTDVLKALHPEGKEYEIHIHNLKNLALEDVDHIGANETAVIQYVGGVWVKSQIFLHLP